MKVKLLEFGKNEAWKKLPAATGNRTQKSGFLEGLFYYTCTFRF